MIMNFKKVVIGVLLVVLAALSSGCIVPSEVLSDSVNFATLALCVSSCPLSLVVATL